MIVKASSKLMAGEELRELALEYLEYREKLAGTPTDHPMLPIRRRLATNTAAMLAEEIARREHPILAHGMIFSACPRDGLQVAPSTLVGKTPWARKAKAEAEAKGRPEGPTRPIHEDLLAALAQFGGDRRKAAEAIGATYGWVYEAVGRLQREGYDVPSAPPFERQRKVTDEQILAALVAHGGDRKDAAASLGLNLQGVYHRIAHMIQAGMPVPPSPSKNGHHKKQPATAGTGTPTMAS